jgi:hypothetical protein
MVTNFSGHNGPSRGSPATRLRFADSDTSTQGKSKASALADADRPPESPNRPGVLRLTRSAMARGIGLCLVSTLVVALVNVVSGRAVDATFNLVTLYFAVGATMSLGVTWVVFIRYAHDRAFAVMCVPLIVGLLDVPGLLPHQTPRRLIIDPGPRGVVSGAYRRISGTTPGPGFVTIQREGSNKVMRISVNRTLRFSTSEKVIGTESRFKIKYFDGSGTPDSVIQSAALTVIGVRDTKEPSIELRRIPNGVAWLVYDNSGAATVEIRMRKPGGALIARWPSQPSRNHSRGETVAPTMFAGVYKFCIHAHDAAGNEAAPKCRWSRVNGQVKN